MTNIYALPRRALRVQLKSWLSLGACLVAGTFLAASVPASAAPTLLFDDEFDGNQINLAVWYRCYPWANELVGCTNGPPYDLEWYWAANVSVANGMLDLVAKRQNAHGYHYTSGLVVTGGSPSAPPGFTYQYGYAEMRAKFPPGHGMWPAFWMLPADGSWPPEIDAVEGQGGKPKIDYATLHWGVERNGHHPSSSTAFNTGVNLSDGFHIYGVDWQADHVTWYFDGRVAKDFRRSQDIPHKPMYLLVDLAVGGWISFPNKNTHFPANLLVDYVRVWSAKP